MAESAEIIIKKIVASELGMDWDKVNDQDDFIADLGADSIDSSLIVSSVNAFFHLSMTLEDASEINRVGDLITWVQARIK